MLAGFSRLTQKRLEACSSLLAYQHVEHLAGNIGVRVAGTPAEREGIQYLKEAFVAYGLPTVEERFPHPLWNEKRVHLQTDSGEFFSAVSPCFGGVGTVEAPVVAVGDPMHATDLQGSDLRGKIALVDGRDVVRDYPDSPQTDLLMAAGALGLIFLAGKDQKAGVPQAFYNYRRWFHGGTPPSAIVTYVDGQRLKGEHVRLTVEAEVIWTQSANIIAEIRGTKLPEEVVIVSAHHDTTPTSPGATDNAGGCGLVAELARVFSKTGAPARTIRFIQLGGHETGIHGSENWLRQHISEIEKVVANINYDGQGALVGEDVAWVLGSSAWHELLQRIVESLGYPLAIKVEPAGVDMTNFAALGINGINLGRYGEQRSHTPADNLEGTGPAGLERALLWGCALLSAIADDVDFPVRERMSWRELKAARDYALRWGWGIVA
jgi:hypothetical protein